jgi:hypothetical protein
MSIKLDKYPQIAIKRAYGESFLPICGPLLLLYTGAQNDFYVHLGLMKPDQLLWLPPYKLLLKSA